MITISADEAALAVKVLGLPDELRTRLASVGPEGLDLSGEEIDQLVDLATDRLMTHGFDANYRPTDEGEALEHLVDRLTAEDADQP